jgi:hypothetical protein
MALQIELGINRLKNIVNLPMAEDIVNEIKEELKNHTDNNGVITGRYKFGNAYIGNVYVRMEIVSATLFEQNIIFAYSVRRKPVDNDSESEQSVRSYNVWVDYTTFKD